MNHLMIDIETMGTKPGCVILSVAAVAFTANGLGESFYARVDGESCERVGLHCDIATVLWWLDKDVKAREEIRRPGENISPVLLRLGNFIQQHAPPDHWVWANSPSFDLSILRHAYGAVQIAVPWDVWCERDYRTIKHLVPAPVVLPRTAGFHHALDDARHQAECCLLMLRKLKTYA